MAIGSESRLRSATILLCAVSMLRCGADSASKQDVAADFVELAAVDLAPDEPLDVTPEVAEPTATVGTVGSAGGLLPMPGGGRLVVPPGALDHDLQISITKRGMVPVSGYKPLGILRVFQPSPLEFLKPVTLEVDLDSETLELVQGGSPIGWAWRSTDGPWVMLAGVLNGATLVTEIDHFSEGEPVLVDDTAGK